MARLPAKRLRSYSLVVRTLDFDYPSEYSSEVPGSNPGRTSSFCLTHLFAISPTLSPNQSMSHHSQLQMTRFSTSAERKFLSVQGLSVDRLIGDALLESFFAISFLRIISLVHLLKKAFFFTVKPFYYCNIVLCQRTAVNDISSWYEPWVGISPRTLPGLRYALFWSVCLLLRADCCLATMWGEFENPFSELFSRNLLLLGEGSCGAVACECTIIQACVTRLCTSVPLSCIDASRHRRVPHLIIVTSSLTIHMLHPI